MNACAKEMSQSNFFTGQWADLRLSKWAFFQLLLLVLILLSAFGVVYATNGYRITATQIQIEAQQQHRLELQWGQLLLESASLATPGHIQQLAEEKLNMMVPTAKQTLVLHLE